MYKHLQNIEDCFQKTKNYFSLIFFTPKVHLFFVAWQNNFRVGTDVDILLEMPDKKNSTWDYQN